MCFVLANATEGKVTVDFKAFLAYSCTELLKALTKNIDTVSNLQSLVYSAISLTSRCIVSEQY